MAFVIQHIESKKFIARKSIANSEYRLTDDLGSAQLYNTIGPAKSTISMMEMDYAEYRRWGYANEYSPHQNVPADGFEIYNLVLSLGDKVQ